MKTSPRRKGPHGSKGGFSLVELMIAVFILAIGLTGLTRGITTSLQSSRVSEVQTMTAMLAAGRIEFIKADGFFMEGEDAGDFGEDYPRFSWKSIITERDPEGLFEVKIEVWDKAVEIKHFELSTLLFDPPVLSSTALENEDEDDSRTGRRRSTR